MLKDLNIRHVLKFAFILLLSSISLTCFITPTPDKNEDYSADNAWESLRIIAEEPRPNGSEQLMKIEEFISDKLREINLPVRIMDYDVANRSGNPVTVRNIYTEIKGEQNQSVLYIAHYDSVPGGPGAGDNGMSVATLLESLRAINSYTNVAKTGIKVLFTDGEELGLLGASAFVENNADLLNNVKFVVNIEGFGKGPVMIIEGNNLADIYFKSVSRPISFSAVSSIAGKALSFDTRPFRENGIPCITIAKVTGSMNYHSPSDSFENASFRSQLHDVDSVYGLMRKTIETDANTWNELLTFKENTSFMPVYGMQVSYNAFFGIILTLLAIVMVSAAVILYIRSNNVNIKHILLFVAGILLFLLLCVIVSRVLFWLISVVTWNPIIKIPFYKRGVTIISICIVAAVMLLSIVYIKKLQKNKSAESFGLVIAAILTVSGCVAAVLVPATAYLPLFSAILISIRMFLKDNKIVYFITNFTNGLLFMPLLYLVITALGAQDITIVLFSIFFLICYVLGRNYGTV